MAIQRSERAARLKLTRMLNEAYLAGWKDGVGHVRQFTNAERLRTPTIPASTLREIERQEL